MHLLKWLGRLFISIYRETYALAEMVSQAIYICIYRETYALAEMVSQWFPLFKQEPVHLPLTNFVVNLTSFLGGVINYALDA